MRLAVAAGVTLALVASVHGESVLDHLPEDALGVAIVHDLAGASAKAEQVAQLFQELIGQPPALLDLMKAATGLGAGLNDNGDAALAFIPGDADEAPAQPIMLLPVADYAAFANSVGGDATGEICRVTIAGQDVLAAKRSGYVMLADIENRDRLAALASTARPPSASMAPLRAWLSNTDVAIILTPSGIEAVGAMADPANTGPLAPSDDQADAAAASGLQWLVQSLGVSRATFRLLGAEFELAALGVAVDERLNLRISTQGVLSRAGTLATWEAPPAPEASPLAAMPNDEFVFAAGGPMPARLADWLPRALRELMYENGSEQGFENFTEADWQKLDESWRTVFAGVSQFSVAYMLGDNDDPLVNNFSAALTVQNARRYIEANILGYAACNDLLAKSTSDVKLLYDKSTVEIAGASGARLTADIAAAASDDRVPGVQAMWRSLFGDDGKFNQYFLPANETTVVFGWSERDEGMRAAVEQAKAEAGGLASREPVEAAIALLDPQSQWQGAVDLRGLVAWTQRAWQALASSLGSRPAPILPEHPAAPPVAFSLKLAEGRITAEAVWHVETLKALAKFLKELEKAILAAA